jgi:hypothetical protein
MARRREEDLHEDPMPAPEALGQHLGQVIAFDEKGQILEAAASWREMMERLGDRELTVMYVPPAGAFVG